MYNQNIGSCTFANKYQSISTFTSEAMIFLKIGLLIFNIFLVTVSATRKVEFEESDVCKGVLSGIQEYPGDCYHYIVCYNEKQSIESCPKNKIFSMDTISCVPGSWVTCDENITEEPQTTEEGSEETTTDEETTDLPTETTTEEDSSEEVEETTPCPINPRTCKFLMWGFKAHPCYCYKYIECQLYKPVERRCPKKHIYNKLMHVCWPGNQNTCSYFS